MNYYETENEIVFGDLLDEDPCFDCPLFDCCDFLDRLDCDLNYDYRLSCYI